MKRLFLGLGILAVAYLSLWGLTAAFGAQVLRPLIEKEVQLEWASVRKEAISKPEIFPGYYERRAFASGPTFKLNVLSCPAPFVVDVGCSRIIGGLNARDTIARYFVTPWRAYVISERRARVS